MVSIPPLICFPATRRIFFQVNRQCEVRLAFDRQTEQNSAFLAYVRQKGAQFGAATMKGFRDVAFGGYQVKCRHRFSGFFFASV